jgi:hypothetical protein
MMKALTTLCAIILFSFLSCNKETAIQGEWITGTEVEKLKKIEKQFRGFDNAMVETGYRYQELYWAGQDQNWEYANYQLEKIKLAIENGLERRPKRAKSAEYFLNHSLPEIKKTIHNEDLTTFNKEFQTMTTNCNNCHAMEKMSYFTVKKPTNRQSPISK